jgi:hypothetical protein
VPGRRYMAALNGHTTGSLNIRDQFQTKERSERDHAGIKASKKSKHTLITYFRYNTVAGPKYEMYGRSGWGIPARHARSRLQETPYNSFFQSRFPESIAQFLVIMRYERYSPSPGIPGLWR